MNLAIIPARGGSKRIPRKNVRSFNGKPIIGWSLETARRCESCDHVIVSTDDEEIASIAQAFGAEVPFRRPAELSDDHTTLIPVIRHAVDWWQSERGVLDSVCCIYPTAPFVLAEDLDRGLDKLDSNPEIDFAFSVTSFPFPIFRAIELEKDDRVSMIWPEHELTRSQDLPEAWHDAGQFYWGRPEAWQKCDRIFQANSIGVPLPRHQVQDIDTEEDWNRAEMMHKVLIMTRNG